MIRASIGALLGWILALALAGCGQRSVGLLTAVPAEKTSLFKATRQVQERPKIVIRNASDIALRLLLNDAAGALTTLDVPARSTRSVEVATVKYEAKIIDPSGNVRGLSGTVWARRYRQYQASFIVDNKHNTQPFYIGD